MIGPMWLKFTKTYQDFATAGTSNTLPVYTLPPGWIVNKAIMKTSVAFAGPGIVGYALTLFQVGNAIFGGSYDGMAAVGGTNFDAAKEDNGFIGKPYDFGNTTAFTLLANSTGANLNVATQGSVTVWLLVVPVP
jgi:hypothetical protein